MRALNPCSTAARVGESRGFNVAAMQLLLNVVDRLNEPLFLFDSYTSSNLN